MSDAAYGVRSSGQNGRYSTALPCNLAAAATWDLKGAYEYGALIGRELRDQGYNMSLGGGINLTREPRNGRTFEYLGEDPILAGTLVGEPLRARRPSTSSATSSTTPSTIRRPDATRSTSISTNAPCGRPTSWPSTSASGIGNPAGVMCSYNRVNGDYACENKYLLTDVLEAGLELPRLCHLRLGRTRTAPRKPPPQGLDNEEPMADFFGERLKKPSKQAKFHVRRSTTTYAGSCAPCSPPASSTTRRKSSVVD